MECWSDDLKKELYTFRFSLGIRSLRAMKKGVSSITPSLQYSSAPQIVKCWQTKSPLGINKAWSVPGFLALYMEGMDNDQKSSYSCG